MTIIVIGWIAWIGSIASAFLITVSLDRNTQLGTPDQKGIASSFGEIGDKWVGGNLYCQPDKRVDSTEHVCAHRRTEFKKRGYPCGTILILENPRTKKRSWCAVMDRGPYGAGVFSFDKEKQSYVQVRKSNGYKQWYVKIRRGDKPPPNKCPSQDCVGRWRAYLDLSPAVSDDLGHNGLELIKSWTLNGIKKRLKYAEEKKLDPRS